MIFVIVNMLLHTFILLIVCGIKGELRSILTLSSFFFVECCQYRQKPTKIHVAFRAVKRLTWKPGCFKHAGTTKGISNALFKKSH